MFGEDGSLRSSESQDRPVGRSGSLSREMTRKKSSKMGHSRPSKIPFFERHSRTGTRSFAGASLREGARGGHDLPLAKDHLAGRARTRRVPLWIRARADAARDRTQENTPVDGMPVQGFGVLGVLQNYSYFCLRGYLDETWIDDGGMCSWGYAARDRALFQHLAVDR